MKYLLTFLFFIGIILFVYSQDLELSLLSSAGSEFKSNETELTYSLGEIAISDYDNDQLVLSEGFQQNFLELSSAIIDSVFQMNYEIYPNPAQEKLYISLDDRNTNHLDIEVFNLKGMNMVSYSTEHWENIIEIDIKACVNGLYFIKIINNTSSQTYPFIIQK